MFSKQKQHFLRSYRGPLRLQRPITWGAGAILGTPQEPCTGEPGKDTHTMYQNRSDALDILTDHAEIQASIFRGAIAEKKELKDIPFFCNARGGSVCVLALREGSRGVRKRNLGDVKSGEGSKVFGKGRGPESPGAGAL